MWRSPKWRLPLCVHFLMNQRKRTQSSLKFLWRSERLLLVIFLPFFELIFIRRPAFPKCPKLWAITAISLLRLSHLEESEVLFLHTCSGPINGRKSWTMTHAFDVYREMLINFSDIDFIFNIMESVVNQYLSNSCLINVLIWKLLKTNKNRSYFLSSVGRSRHDKIISHN